MSEEQKCAAVQIMNPAVGPRQAVEEIMQIWDALIVDPTCNMVQVDI